MVEVAQVVSILRFKDQSDSKPVCRRGICPASVEYYLYVFAVFFHRMFYTCIHNIGTYCSAWKKPE
jgi:hypothetical protein